MEGPLALLVQPTSENGLASQKTVRCAVAGLCQAGQFLNWLKESDTHVFDLSNLTRPFSCSIWPHPAPKVMDNPAPLNERKETASAPSQASCLGTFPPEHSQSLQRVLARVPGIRNACHQDDPRISQRWCRVSRYHNRKCADGRQRPTARPAAFADARRHQSACPIIDRVSLAYLSQQTDRQPDNRETIGTPETSSPSADFARRDRTSRCRCVPNRSTITARASR
jgi:hypothetical protein